MANYTIKKLDNVSRSLLVTVSKEGKPTINWSIALPETYNEAIVHEYAEKAVYEVECYWVMESTAPELELTTLEGTAKDHVFETKPSYDPAYQKCEQSISETETTKTYGWTVSDLTVEEIATTVRRKRDHYLKTTDSYALADRSLGEEMREYRQSLRDLTDQEGFPTSVIWPVKPLD